MARKIDARGIPWWRALLVFPFLLGPWILLKGAVAALWRALRHAREKWRERPDERRPPEPTGLGLFVLAFLFAGGVLSITFAAEGAHRVAATGLMLVTLATVFVSPALLSLDALARLDDWWISTDLPAYQLAFGHYGRRIVLLGLRLALTAVSAIFVFGAVDVVLSAFPLPKSARDGVDSALVLLAWSFIVSVTAAVVGGALRLIVGSPSAANAAP